ncbi:tRNA-dihydrouridine synthase [Anaerofustis sp. NSJ-163]|uniref:tRNA dihydrouridine synthase n=1 Tax=Anaerofustis sp. NSJ-163 TaxID=2944391 RepID=UPI00209C18E4|nr:tRNA-dihydrouridine synthase family protein [Anaerofustis sp. NSJ-163]MCO8193514.1 tRNA-dihydrouridine synthase family protein [Anaerofustis sp. NSJ-163]
MTKTKNNYFSKLFKQNKGILAPMAGVTNLPYRIFMKEMGCRIFVSEMVSAKGIFYGSKNTFPLMETNEIEHRDCACGIQIFGSDPEIMGKITDEHLNDTEFDFIDINMGCPMKKIVNNGDGSALLKDLVKAREVTEAVKKNSTKPLSVKVRLGFNEKYILDIIKAVEDGGADMITVHGRTREQVFTGEVDYDEIKKAKENADVPIVVNGDLDNYLKAKEKMDYTKTDAVMIGRGANYDPFIFSQFNELIEGKEVSVYNNQDKINAARKHFEIHMKYSTAKKSVVEFRKYLYWYIKGIKNSAKIRNSINNIFEQEQVYEVFDRIDDILKEGE